MYAKSAIILAWAVATYVLLVFWASTWWQAIPLSVSMGLSLAAIGFCIQHDGGHRAFSRHQWVNRIAASTLDLIGASSYIWDHKHNTLHHTYANIAHHDDDIEMGVLGRLAPHQKRYFFHRWQHFYVWLLYGILPIKWHFWDDTRDLIFAKIGTHRFARPRGGKLAILIAGKVLFTTLAFVLPLSLHVWWHALGCYLIAFWVCGCVISVVFQLAHVVEEAQFPQPDAATGRLPTHWAVHQVETTVDFARRNPFLTWFLGGLNYQVEHHLFPRVCHIHYPKLSRVVENACRRHGIEYHAHPSVWSAIASHFRWLRRMGSPEGAH